MASLLAACGMWHGGLQAGPPKPAGCLIEPDRVADVGSSVTGIIEQLPVALGDTVRSGQTLAVLRADVERASAQAASMRASIDAEVKAANANLVMARQKEQRARQLVQQAFLSDQALEQATAEADIAQQKLRLAQGQLRLNAQDRAVAHAQLALRTLHSPINGVVVERYLNLGERVEDRPVLRIADIDTLRVSLMVPLAQYGQVKKGDTLLIRPELTGQAPVRATVSYVDKVVDAASNTFRVRLSLPNADHHLPGGLRCKADWEASAREPSPALAPAHSPTPAPAAVTPTAPAQPNAARVQATSWPTAPGPSPFLTATLRIDRLQLKSSMTLSARPDVARRIKPRHDTPNARLTLTLALLSSR
jgi:cobalt-zinc-cadmium efflux system membrane fusion protein